MNASFVEEYCRWWRRNAALAVDPERRCASLALAHHVGVGARGLAPRLIDYLNCFDESDGGGWLLFDAARIDWVLGPEVGTLASGVPRPVLAAAAGEGDPAPRRELLQWLSRVGSCVFLGSEPAWLASPLPWVFRVLVTGSRDRRIQEVMRTGCLDRVGATALVEAGDSEASSCAERHCGGRADDPTHFHLVVNSDSIRESMLISLIGDSLLEWAARLPAMPLAPATASGQDMRAQSQDVKRIP